MLNFNPYIILFFSYLHIIKQVCLVYLCVKNIVDVIGQSYSTLVCVMTQMAICIIQMTICLILNDTLQRVTWLWNVHFKISEYCLILLQLRTLFIDVRLIGSIVQKYFPWFVNKLDGDILASHLAIFSSPVPRITIYQVLHLG